MLSWRHTSIRSFASLSMLELLRACDVITFIKVFRAETCSYKTHLGLRKHITGPGDTLIYPATWSYSPKYFRNFFSSSTTWNRHLSNGPEVRCVLNISIISRGHFSRKEAGGNAGESQAKMNFFFHPLGTRVGSTAGAPGPPYLLATVSSIIQSFFLRTGTLHGGV